MRKEGVVKLRAPALGVQGGVSTGSNESRGSRCGTTRPGLDEGKGNAKLGQMSPVPDEFGGKTHVISQNV